MTKSISPHTGAAVDSLMVIVQRLPKDQETFLGNGILQDATLMRLQDAGEQLVRIRENFPEYYDQHHNESWHKLIGLRNIISHGYLEINMHKVWEIVSTDIPDLIRQLNKLDEAK